MGWGDKLAGAAVLASWWRAARYLLRSLSDGPRGRGRWHGGVAGKENELWWGRAWEKEGGSEWHMGVPVFS